MPNTNQDTRNVEYSECFNFFKHINDFSAKNLGFMLAFNGALLTVVIQYVQLKEGKLLLSIFGLLITFLFYQIRKKLKVTVDITLKRLVEIEEDLGYSFIKRLDEQGNHRTTKFFFYIYVVVMLAWIGEIIVLFYVS